MCIRDRLTGRASRRKVVARQNVLPISFSLLGTLSTNERSERLDDPFHDLLGVAEQHHGVVAEEELVLDAGVARAHAALDEQHGAGAVSYTHLRAHETP